MVANGSLRALVLKAKALLDEEKFIEALAVLHEAAGETPQPSSWISWARCVALDLLNRPAEALAAADEALESDPFPRSTVSLDT